MGGIRSKIDSQQVLIVGLQSSGKSLFLKKILELKKKETEDISLDSTVGYNYTTINYSDATFDIWDLGGDPICCSYWPTFYHNLKFTLVVFFINLNDVDSHCVALKELIVIINQEELKQARFFIVFNVISDEMKKMGNNELGSIKENKELAESLMADLRECPIHDYEARVLWDIIDVSKIKDGENKTTELLAKCLFGSIDKKDSN